MKGVKVLLLIIMMGFLLTFSACTNNDDNNVTDIKDDDTPSDSVQDETDIDETDEDDAPLVDDSLNDDVTVSQKVLLDQEGVVITLKSLEVDDFFGPALKVLVENNNDKSVTVQVRDSAINDIMIENMFSSEVAANKSANDDITFMQSDLDRAGVETIKDIEFRFHVFDTETWDSIFDSDTINITTTAEDYVQNYDDSGTVALEENGFRLIIKRMDNQESLWGADIYVYIENNSEVDATVQARDVSINGLMVEPLFSSDILAGKKAYDTITFLEDDLINNDIEVIDEMGMSFHVFNTETWDTIFDSEPVEVIFGE